jgi:hypothetical protein
MASAQDNSFACASVRPSSALKPGYSRHASAPICEGFYDRNVSQPYVEVVSALLQPFSSLRLLDSAAFSLTPRVAPKAAMTLIVQPLPVSTLYRVDARIDNAQVKWDPASMLSLTKLKLSQIGYLAVVKPRPGHSLVVAPLSVSTAASAPSNSVFITIRVSTEISQLKWRTYPTFGKVHDDLAWSDALKRPLYRWAAYTLTVPLPADGPSITLELNAFDKKKEPLKTVQLVIAGSDYDRL